MEEIAGLLLKALTGRAKEQMNLTIRISPAVKKYVAKKGFSPKYGARPVRRVIQNEIENPAAEMIVRGECGEGGTLSVSVRGGQLQLTAE